MKRNDRGGETTAPRDHCAQLWREPLRAAQGLVVWVMAAWVSVVSTPASAVDATPAEALLTRAMAQAQALAAQGRPEACEAALVAHEAQAWQAPAPLRNRWHRQVWICTARPQVGDLAAMRRHAAWMQRWIDCCAREPGVDIRFRASTRVIGWTYRQAAGEDMRDEIDRHLRPLVEVVLSQPAPQRPPQDPALSEPLTELLLVLGELGGQGPLEPLLLAWREHIAAAAGDHHVAVLMADKSLAFSARKYGRLPQSLQLIQAAWDRYEAAGFDWPALRQALASEMAATLGDSGRVGPALRYAALTQAILEQLDGPHGLRPGRAAYNHASLALVVGDFERARDQALRAIKALTGGGSSWSEEEVHYPRQLLHRARLELGEPGAADDLERALDLSSVGSDWVHVSARRLLQHARATGDDARAQRMQRYIAENLRRTKPVFHPAHVASLLMEAPETPSDTPAIEPAAVQALVQAQTSASAPALAQAWVALARRWMRPPQPAPIAALWAVKRAARALLPQLGELSPSHQAGMLDQEREVLHQLQEATVWFVEQGRLPEAEALASELQLGEARHYLRGGLHSPLRGTAEGFLPDTPQEARWSHQLDALLAQSRETRDQLLQTVPDKPLAADPTAEGRAQAERHRDQLQAFTEAWSAWLDGLRAQAVVPSIAPPAIADVRLAIAPGEALVWWAIGSDRLRIVAQTRRDRHEVEVTAGSAAVARAVLNARQAATDEARLDLSALQALHQLLLAPIEPWLQARAVRHLTLRPTTLLMSAPFAALHRGAGEQPWLVQRYTLRIRLADRPAGSVAAPARPMPQLLHAFGTTVAHGALPPLPWVREELRWVTRRTGPTSRRWLDGDFTWKTLQHALASRPPRDGPRRPMLSVHLASHFRLHPGTAALSWLQLGDGQRASLDELMALPWGHSRLTVASACDTATAQGAEAPLPNGVALNSLAQGLLGAGSQAVVGSVWAVRDESTAHLMDRLYARIQGPMPGHRALSVVQRDWLNRHRGRAWGHPRHWAAWIWME